MLTTLFPKACHAHSSLPLLGSIADNFDDWLLDRGYKVTSRTNAIEMLHHIDSDLRRRGIKHIVPVRRTHMSRRRARRLERAVGQDWVADFAACQRSGSNSSSWLCG